MNAKWVPTTNLMMLRRMGKLQEELHELGEVAARCIIQGIDEIDPGTGKVNRDRLELESADVYAQLDETIYRLALNVDAIEARRADKRSKMRAWEDRFAPAAAETTGDIPISATAVAQPPVKPRPMSTSDARFALMMVSGVSGDRMEYGHFPSPEMAEAVGKLLLDEDEKDAPEWSHYEIEPVSIPAAPVVSTCDREFLGKAVRLEWIAWAGEQANPKPSWLVPWDGLAEPDREVDRRIGERIYRVAAFESARLRGLINHPEIDAFLRGTHIEAIHQVERWGAAHDRAKSPADWYWLVGHLCGKALHSAEAGNVDKALHHCISTTAALYNWHCAILGVDVRMCPGRSDLAQLVDRIFPGEATERAA